LNFNYARLGLIHKNIDTEKKILHAHMATEEKKSMILNEYEVIIGTEEYQRGRMGCLRYLIGSFSP
jgi:hypothetical protein